MAGPRWEHFAHQADIGVRGLGATPAEAFALAAVALTAVVADPRRIAPVEPVRIACAAPAADLLLVDWLSAVLLEMGRRKMLFSRFEVRLDGERLEATVWGEPLDVAWHQPAVEVKGVSFAELAVRRTEAGEWLAQCVVDV